MKVTQKPFNSGAQYQSGGEGRHYKGVPREREREEQQHFNLAKYSLCSSVDLRQMALNGKAETCQAKRWTPCCIRYPLFLPLPFSLSLSPSLCFPLWARKTLQVAWPLSSDVFIVVLQSQFLTLSRAVLVPALVLSLPPLSLSLSCLPVSFYSSCCLSSSTLHCANFYKVMKSHSSAWP